MSLGAPAAAGCEEDEALELAAAVRALFLGGMVTMFGVSIQEQREVQGTLTNGTIFSDRPRGSHRPTSNEELPEV